MIVHGISCDSTSTSYQNKLSLTLDIGKEWFLVKKKKSVEVLTESLIESTVLTHATCHSIKCMMKWNKIWKMISCASILELVILL